VTNPFLLWRSCCRDAVLHEVKLLGPKPNHGNLVAAIQNTLTLAQEGHFFLFA
jgi:hypothetical protein